MKINYSPIDEFEISSGTQVMYINNLLIPKLGSVINKLIKITYIFKMAKS